jgi:hypothetical protein
VEWDGRCTVFALAEDDPYPAAELLWPDHLTRPDLVKKNGDFRFPNGVPFLRVWLCERVTPFVELTGRQSSFNNNYGSRVVPLDQVVAGLHEAALDVPLRSAELDRPPHFPGDHKGD